MKRHPHASLTFRLHTILALVAGTTGCSDDNAAPPSPPALRIQGVSLSGGSKWSRGDEGTPTLEFGCTAEQLTVTVGPSQSAYQLGEWELRAPGSCGGDESCGYLRLTVEGPEGRIAKSSARRYIEVSTDELPGLGGLGLTVELLSDWGSPIESNDLPVAESIDIELAQASGCAAP